jgi:predicted PurR-regulated permease PerM
VRAAASTTPEQLLHQLQGDPGTLAALRQEWIKDSIDSELVKVKESSRYQEQFRDYYENRRAAKPQEMPYAFDQYLELQKVRPQGPRVFGETLDKLMPSAQSETEAQLRADFEAAKEHELFENWWSTSGVARFIRHELESSASEEDSSRVEHILTSLLNIPLDIITALLLSFFICIDFPTLQRAIQKLRETWLRDVYYELAPVMSQLALLIGRAMFAQGLISLCNATLIFVALTVLGVDHAVLLSGVVFILCLVPTLGMILAWVLLVAAALIQPGGGLALALKVSGAVVLVILMETLVFSPRILGRMMELHPVLIIALLPLAQYFFGIWGLILSTPVAVYVIHVLILRRGLPGEEATRAAAQDRPGGL